MMRKLPPVLETVNYKTLGTKVKKKPRIQIIKPGKCKVKPLLDLCFQGLVGYPAQAGEAVSVIPVHLIYTLFTEAVAQGELPAIVSIIENWPLPVFCFREVLPEAFHNIFEEEMKYDVCIFKGIVSRTPKCQMKEVDFRGLILNEHFLKLIIQIWPIISLRKSQRDEKRLTRIVVETSGLAPGTELAKEIIPNLVRNRLNLTVVRRPEFSIEVPRGERFMVHLDSLQFSIQEGGSLEFLVTNCLRTITPLQINVANLLVKTDALSAYQNRGYVEPSIVFRGQDPHILHGVAVELFEEEALVNSARLFTKFRFIRALSLRNCCICLRAGKTRKRTYFRTKMTQILSGFVQLRRLDLGENFFPGCLEELLESVSQQLEYLSLSGCDDLQKCDLKYLVHSKHSESLKELDLSQTMMPHPHFEEEMTPILVLNNLVHLPNIVVLNLSHNYLADTAGIVKGLCNVLTHHQEALRVLYVGEDMFTRNDTIEIIRTCVKRQNMRLLSMSHPFEFGLNRSEFEALMREEVKRTSRNDLEVEFKKLAHPQNHWLEY